MDDPRDGGIQRERTSRESRKFLAFKKFEHYNYGTFDNFKKDETKRKGNQIINVVSFGRKKQGKGQPFCLELIKFLVQFKIQLYNDYLYSYIMIIYIVI